MPTTASAFDDLNAQGLNLQAVFNIGDLPQNIKDTLQAYPHYRQLILIGHAGPLLWQKINKEGMADEHPIDSFSQKHVSAWLATRHPQARYHYLYPGPTSIGLQSLGALAGWHHPSPFMVGINQTWGSWFAYRALVLADTDLPITLTTQSASPCTSCASRICVKSCPANAMQEGFNLNACLSYRRQTNSLCKDRCIARNSCPVGEEHRYSEAQISYHYGRSMTMIAKIGDERK